MICEIIKPNLHSFNKGDEMEKGENYMEALTSFGKNEKYALAVDFDTCRLEGNEKKKAMRLWLVHYAC